MRDIILLVAIIILVLWLIGYVRVGRALSTREDTFPQLHKKPVPPEHTPPVEK